MLGQGCTLQLEVGQGLTTLPPYNMGTELSKQERGESVGSAAEPSTATTPAIAAKWHAWLQDAEGLYLQGRFRAYREVRACCCEFFFFWWSSRNKLFSVCAVLHVGNLNLKDPILSCICHRLSCLTAVLPLCFFYARVLEGIACILPDFARSVWPAVSVN